jgi:hypothetical protein
MGGISTVAVFTLHVRKECVCCTVGTHYMLEVFPAVFPACMQLLYSCQAVWT